MLKWINRYFVFLFVFLNALNILDASFTTWKVRSGDAYELNPLMFVLLMRSVALFLVVKVVLVLLGSFLLLRLRKYTFSKVCMVIMCLLYFLLILYHVVFLF